jgi:hypothetical protein
MQTRRQRARGIGHEHEWDRLMGSDTYEQYMRLINLPRLRGPSDP